MSLQRIIEIVSKYSNTPVFEDAALFHDLGLYGDDASDLLADICDQFPVSFEGFDFGSYFPDEPGLFNFLNKSQYTPISVRGLANFVASGPHWHSFARQNPIG